MKQKLLYLGVLLLFFSAAFAQENTNKSKFKQLIEELPTPNVYRTASGAPGHLYWQQKANYKIKLTLDDEKQKISGQENVIYYNNSPDPLNYLWVQLDQNRKDQQSMANTTMTGKIGEKMSGNMLYYMQNDFDGKFHITKLTDKNGEKLPHIINGTMLRIDLATPLLPGKQFEFNVDWWYNINDRALIWGRSGYEYFPENDNYLYTIAQFYPRMAVYSDFQGWQNKQFLGRGEFALVFGDYEVEITVPSDHVVAATGELQNMNDVLTKNQIQLYEKAKTATDPVMIVSEKEARKAEKSKASDTKTWKFKAENVRDFAFASSRKFIWDAIGVKFGDRTVMAMSFYPKEGNPLWEKYSTRVVAHTLNVYSKHTFDYPYPVAQSIHATSIGMEYPMVAFNGGRPEKDGTYSERTKYGMIGVIIHEIGHNYFPMIVNSDERQWSWMDEGLNTFLQYLTEQAWEKGYPSRRGKASSIVDYMKGDKSSMVPIMTNSESIKQFHNNAYAKPAVGLNILRETIMGRELFDYAFKTFAQRWMFKHPTPADFFRTMEDASAVDLDWFWRGWFMSTDHVDMSIDKVQLFRLNSLDPEKEAQFQKAKRDEFVDISTLRDKNVERYADKDPRMNDFYNSYDELDVTDKIRDEYKKQKSAMNDLDKRLTKENKFYYQVDFSNKGGLFMPVILRLNYTDGSDEVLRIPVEIWRSNEKEFSKVLILNKELTAIEMDPYQETADTDISNNYWPPRMEESRFELYKRQNYSRPNPMQQRTK